MPHGARCSRGCRGLRPSPAALAPPQQGRAWLGRPQHPREVPLGRGISHQPPRPPKPSRAPPPRLHPAAHPGAQRRGLRGRLWRGAEPGPPAPLRAPGAPRRSRGRRGRRAACQRGGGSAGWGARGARGAGSGAGAGGGREERAETKGPGQDSGQQGLGAEGGQAPGASPAHQGSSHPTCCHLPPWDRGPLPQDLPHIPATTASRERGTGRDGAPPLYTHPGLQDTASHPRPATPSPYHSGVSGGTAAPPALFPLTEPPQTTLAGPPRLSYGQGAGRVCSPGPVPAQEAPSPAGAQHPPGQGWGQRVNVPRWPRSGRS